MSAILHVYDASLPNPQQSLEDGLKLKPTQSGGMIDKLKMDRMIDTHVCDLFHGERFHGEVTKVIYHDIHAQYMYHVVWEDDDESDCWRHELEMIVCRCPTDTDSVS